MPFRDAHETVGRIVIRAIERGVEINELRLDEMRSFSPLIEEDVFEVLSLEKTLTAKGEIGGTSPARVQEALSAARHGL